MDKRPHTSTVSTSEKEAVVSRGDRSEWLLGSSRQHLCRKEQNEMTRKKKKVSLCCQDKTNLKGLGFSGAYFSTAILVQQPRTLKYPSRAPEIHLALCLKPPAVTVVTLSAASVLWTCEFVYNYIYSLNSKTHSFKSVSQVKKKPIYFLIYLIFYLQFFLSFKSFKKHLGNDKTTRCCKKPQSSSKETKPWRFDNVGLTFLEEQKLKNL